MSLDFSSATILGIQHNSDFFGDNIARYRTVQRISVQGQATALTNTEGVQPVYAEISGLINGATDYDNISINGVSFGNGRVLSLNFGESPNRDVYYKPYTVELEVYRTGSLGNLTTGYYTGLTYTNFEKILNISESFDYTNDEKHSYSHSLSLQLSSGSDGNNPITLAKTIATNLFASVGLNDFLGTYNNLPSKKYYTETYNVITNACNWVQNCEYAGNSGDYSLEYTSSLNTNEEGITNGTEDGQIKGLTLPIWTSAENGLATEKPKIYNRVSGVYRAYFGASTILFSSPISQRFSINKVAATIDYSLSYTNDASFSGQYQWNYTQELNKNVNEVVSVSENGNVVGYGRPGSEKFSNAETAYTNDILPGLGARITGFYQEQTALSLNLFQVESLLSKNMIEGTVEYGRTYTDDSSYLTGEIKKADIQITQNYPVLITNKFNIPNVKELIQPSNNLYTLAQRDISVSTIGGRSTSMATFLNDAKIRIRPHTGLYEDSYLQDCNYSLARNTNTFDMQLTIIGHGTGAAFGVTDI